MGPLGPDDMIRMAEHYFGKDALSASQKEKLPRHVVAAQLENLCGSCSTIEELCRRLVEESEGV